MAKPEVSLSRLRELLHYDPETGVFTWIAKSTKFSKNQIGKVAGADGGQGYLRIYIDNYSYLAHRLAWLYVYGRSPGDVIDHINRNRSDNRIANLRESTTSENSQNRYAYSLRKTKTLGVFYRKGKYTARIGVTLAGKKMKILLGTHDTEQEAAAVYVAAKALLHPTAWATLPDTSVNP